MEQAIRTAWKAFWIALGASAVLLAQAVLPPALNAPSSPPSQLVAPVETPPVRVSQSAGGADVSRRASVRVARKDMHQT